MKSSDLLEPFSVALRRELQQTAQKQQQRSLGGEVRSPRREAADVLASPPSRTRSSGATDGKASGLSPVPDWQEEKRARLQAELSEVVDAEARAHSEAIRECVGSEHEVNLCERLQRDLADKLRGLSTSREQLHEVHSDGNVEAECRRLQEDLRAALTAESNAFRCAASASCRNKELQSDCESLRLRIQDAQEALKGMRVLVGRGQPWEKHLRQRALLERQVLRATQAEEKALTMMADLYNRIQHAQAEKELLFVQLEDALSAERRLVSLSPAAIASEASGAGHSATAELAQLQRLEDRATKIQDAETGAMESCRSVLEKHEELQVECEELRVSLSSVMTSNREISPPAGGSAAGGGSFHVITPSDKIRHDISRLLKTQIDIHSVALEACREKEGLRVERDLLRAFVVADHNRTAASHQRVSSSVRSQENGNEPSVPAVDLQTNERLKQLEETVKQEAAAIDHLKSEVLQEQAGSGKHRRQLEELQLMLKQESFAVSRHRTAADEQVARAQSGEAAAVQSAQRAHQEELQAAKTAQREEVDEISRKQESAQQDAHRLAEQLLKEKLAAKEEQHLRQREVDAERHGLEVQQAVARLTATSAAELQEKLHEVSKEYERSLLQLESKVAKLQLQEQEVECRGVEEMRRLRDDARRSAWKGEEAVQARIENAAAEKHLEVLQKHGDEIRRTEESYEALARSNKLVTAAKASLEDKQAKLEDRLSSISAEAKKWKQLEAAHADGLQEVEASQLESVKVEVQQLEEKHKVHCSRLKEELGQEVKEAVQTHEVNGQLLAARETAQSLELKTLQKTMEALQISLTHAQVENEISSQNASRAQQQALKSLEARLQQESARALEAYETRSRQELAKAAADARERCASLEKLSEAEVEEAKVREEELRRRDRAAAQAEAARWREEHEATHAAYSAVAAECQLLQGSTSEAEELQQRIAALQQDIEQVRLREQQAAETAARAEASAREGKEEMEIEMSQEVEDFEQEIYERYEEEVLEVHAEAQERLLSLENDSAHTVQQLQAREADSKAAETRSYKATRRSLLQTEVHLGQVEASVNSLEAKTGAAEVMLGGAEFQWEEAEERYTSMETVLNQTARLHQKAESRCAEAVEEQLFWQSLSAKHLKSLRVCEEELREDAESFEQILESRDLECQSLALEVDDARQEMEEVAQLRTELQIVEEGEQSALARLVEEFEDDLSTQQDSHELSVEGLRQHLELAREERSEAWRREALSEERQVPFAEDAQRNSRLEDIVQRLVLECQYVKEEAATTQAQADSARRQLHAEALREQTLEAQYLDLRRGSEVLAEQAVREDEANQTETKALRQRLSEVSGQLEMLAAAAQANMRSRAEYAEGSVDGAGMDILIGEANERSAALSARVELLEEELREQEGATHAAAMRTPLADAPCRAEGHVTNGQQKPASRPSATEQEPMQLVEVHRRTEDRREIQALLEVLERQRRQEQAHSEVEEKLEAAQDETRRLRSLVAAHEKAADPKPGDSLRPQPAEPWPGRESLLAAAPSSAASSPAGNEFPREYSLTREKPRTVQAGMRALEAQVASLTESLQVQEASKEAWKEAYMEVEAESAARTAQQPPWSEDGGGRAAAPLRQGSGSPAGLPPGKEADFATQQKEPTLTQTAGHLRLELEQSEEASKVALREERSLAVEAQRREREMTDAYRDATLELHFSEVEARKLTRELDESRRSAEGLQEELRSHMEAELRATQLLVASTRRDEQAQQDIMRFRHAEARALETERRTESALRSEEASATATLRELEAEVMDQRRRLKDQGGDHKSQEVQVEMQLKELSTELQASRHALAQEHALAAHTRNEERQGRAEWYAATQEVHDMEGEARQLAMRLRESQETVEGLETEVRNQMEAELQATHLLLASTRNDEHARHEVVRHRRQEERAQDCEVNVEHCLRAAREELSSLEANVVARQQAEHQMQFAMKSMREAELACVAEVQLYRHREASALEELEDAVSQQSRRRPARDNGNISLSPYSAAEQMLSQTVPPSESSFLRGSPQQFDMTPYPEGLLGDSPQLMSSRLSPGGDGASLQAAQLERTDLSLLGGTSSLAGRSGSLERLLDADTSALAAQARQSLNTELLLLTQQVSSLQTELQRRGSRQEGLSPIPEHLLGSREALRPLPPDDNDSVVSLNESDDDPYVLT
eukprot:TRINITY_DN43409_c0_g2_i1.p1 TRINITY_DN43409_c0_g2~~TRINITY_DN43409_c0_g2_i1.p1  ORF type:complete len:2179 (+),score=656.04 TRINITY_DN43409_c0_g2_i1:141-6677(+)